MKGAALIRELSLQKLKLKKLASAVEASFSGTLRKTVAEGDVVYPVGALLAVVADEAVTDAEVDQFIEKFQAEFVPPEDDDDEELNLSEFAEVNGEKLCYVSKGEGDDGTLFYYMVLVVI